MWKVIHIINNQFIYYDWVNRGILSVDKINGTERVDNESYETTYSCTLVHCYNSDWEWE